MDINETHSPRLDVHIFPGEPLNPDETLLMFEASLGDDEPFRTATLTVPEADTFEWWGDYTIFVDNFPEYSTIFDAGNAMTLAEVYEAEVA